MGRRTNSPIEDVMDITSKLTWWVGVTLAAISYFALHWYTMQEPPKPLNEMISKDCSTVMRNLFLLILTVSLLPSLASVSHKMPFHKCWRPGGAVK